MEGSGLPAVWDEEKVEEYLGAEMSKKKWNKGNKGMVSKRNPAYFTILLYIHITRR